jgi:hypothetical protein
LQLFEGKPARLVTGVHNTDLRLPGTKYPATTVVPDFFNCCIQAERATIG